MSRKIKETTPTDEEILSYTNVPVEVAARYIGWSSCNIAWALQQERAPYGHAAQTGVNRETGYPTYSYNISPGLLVKYKRGELEAWRLSALADVITTEFGKMVEEHLGDMLAVRFAQTGGHGKDKL